MASGQPYVLHHPQLGEIQGVLRNDEIIQFRGLPYAEIPARFRQARLRESLPQTPFDATRTGSICPQNLALPFPPLWTDGEDTERFPAAEPDEFNCLNLNVTVPRAELEAKKRLPVMIFIHGGGFVVGSASVRVAGREIYDPTNLVQVSCEIGLPLIVVTINYRLGALGFLASNEFRIFNESHNEAVGNYGLHDQRVAIEWVYKFIAGFGGDAASITLQGASAGGASSHFQAVFPDTKVKGAILASGTALALGAMPFKYHQLRFDALVDLLDCDGHNIVSALQSVPTERLVNRTEGVQPLIDNVWIRGRTMTWLQDTPSPVNLLIGSCESEDDVLLALLGFWPKPPDAASLTSRIKALLEPTGITSNPNDYLSADLLSAYNLSFPVTDPSSIHRWATYLADIVFRIPPIPIASEAFTEYTRRGHVYLYDFKATSPYPYWRPGYGKAHHAVTDVFLFDVAADKVPAEHLSDWRQAVTELQRAWISFCYGRTEWEAAADTGTGRDADSHDALPIYVLENGRQWMKSMGLKSFGGQEVVKRCMELLKIVEKK